MLFYNPVQICSCVPFGFKPHYRFVFTGARDKQVLVDNISLHGAERSTVHQNRVPDYQGKHSMHSGTMACSISSVKCL
jgi:hypothetical protein